MQICGMDCAAADDSSVIDHGGQLSWHSPPWPACARLHTCRSAAGTMRAMCTQGRSARGVVWTGSAHWSWWSSGWMRPSSPRIARKRVCRAGRALRCWLCARARRGPRWPRGRRHRQRRAMPGACLRTLLVRRAYACLCVGYRFARDAHSDACACGCTHHEVMMCWISTQARGDGAAADAAATSGCIATKDVALVSAQSRKGRSLDARSVPKRWP